MTGGEIMANSSRHGRAFTPSSIALATCGIGVLAFLALPILIVVPMSFSSAESLRFPPPGFSLRWYVSFFGDPQWLEAATNSLVIGVTSSTIALALGTMAAYGLVRGGFRGRRLVEANFIAPMVLPPVIVAVALYIFYARLGILGSYLALIAAHAVLAVPYVVLLMSLAIQAFDIRIEQVAMTLGASRAQMMLRVLLPNLLPNAAAAWLFAFVISFDEVVVTLFVSGTHLTVPKRMFNQLVLQINPTITAIATLLILFSLTAVAIGSWLARGSTLMPGRSDDRSGQ
jgi:ABC-type spermidine/putrescine transport system permease subunit II